MFPRTFSTVALIVGAIWLIQGLGIADTGSFMDGRRGWAVAGAILVVTGLAALFQQRRRQGSEPSQPGS